MTEQDEKFYDYLLDNDLRMFWIDTHTCVACNTVSYN